VVDEAVDEATELIDAGPEEAACDDEETVAGEFDWKDAFLLTLGEGLSLPASLEL